MLQQIYDEKKKYFSKSDYKIMDCLMKNQSDIQYITTAFIADSLGISESTISRFFSKIGCKNLSDFKLMVRNSELSTPSKRTSSAKKQWDETSDPIINTSSLYLKHIEKTLEQLTPEKISCAVHMLQNAKKIYVFSTEASYGLSAIMQYRLRRMGIEFIYINSGSQIYESIINISSRDLVIMFSYSRILMEIRILLEHAGTVHCKTILFTDLLAAHELSMADLVLYSYRGEPNEYHSMVAPLTIIDMIILQFTNECNDSVEKAEYLENIRDRYSNYIKR